ncbi:DDE-type integrase/transposase/recombinase [Terasakiella pusilla]|uniref:DDE-type integrase/transposase/recombinase n=1 Tax=Terasakiella pusilla TaxID=64973 RepID=UPI003AA89ED3
MSIGELRTTIDQIVLLSGVRLTARRNTKAARSFLKHLREAALPYYPLTTISDKIDSYAKVTDKNDTQLRPKDAIRQADLKRSKSDLRYHPSQILN